jgi:ribose 5-phosphate isomerase B
MIVAIGVDAAGVVMKEAILGELRAAGAEVRDFSPSPADDYPDVAEAVARAVAADDAERGILICGTGIGMSISANKVEGVRAALCADPYSARMSREHNDANVLCLGGRTIGIGAATEIVRAWLGAGPSDEERHVRRRGKVDGIESNKGTAP